MTYSQQLKEIPTIREREIELRLSDADCERITEFCERYGLTLSELLRSFIGDLVDGTHSNGSDERMYAQEWLDNSRSNFSNRKSLLYYLFTNGSIDDLIDTLNDIRIVKKEVEACEKHKDAEDLAEAKMDLKLYEEELENMLWDYMNDNNPTANIQQEIQDCIEWKNQRDKFVGLK